MKNNKPNNDNTTAEKNDQNGHAPRQGHARYNRYNRNRRPHQDSREKQQQSGETNVIKNHENPGESQSNAVQNQQSPAHASRNNHSNQDVQSVSPVQSGHDEQNNQRQRQNQTRNNRRNGNRPYNKQQRVHADAAQQSDKRDANTTNDDTLPRKYRSTGRPANYGRERELKDELPPEVVFISAPESIPAPAPGVVTKVGDPDFSVFDFDKPEPAEAPANDPDAVEVIGVRFRKSSKVYYFSPGNIIMNRGDNVIVETARGPEFGEVSLSNRRVSAKDIVQPLRPMIRPATAEDEEHNLQNRQKEADAFVLCREKIAKHGLDMKLVDAQYTFDNSKLLFYFTSAGRVDFRELVKDLAAVFRTRIELRQIGIRDEAKMLGGLGACGRPLCCASFLSDFVQVSIKMAKEQNLSLNSNKISGACGRLMCCLRYENDTYEAELRLTPPVDSIVRTPEGNGVVTEVNPLAGTVKVKITDSNKQETSIIQFHRDNVTVLSCPRTQDNIQNDETKND